MPSIRHPRVSGSQSLPAVGVLVNQPAYTELIAARGRSRVVEAIRAQLAGERGGEAVGDEERIRLVAQRLSEHAAPRLKRVINGTGVILHTNLGRAPLPASALEAIATATGYSNLELDLTTGRRGERSGLLEPLLRELFDCGAALVVNNNAAAVLLALTALGKGREVVVSRGQLVEIGGSFRMPDVMRLSGVRMVEVGTTNRTRASDYEAAITPKTSALLRVHTSNFRISGFTESTPLTAMAEVALRHGLLLIDDLGSGSPRPIGDEPTVAESLQSSDLVTFSGDKLIGGPQAGIALARTVPGVQALERMARHPLARAVRIDKLTAAALEATLFERLAGREADLPVERMLNATALELKRRAAMWSVKLADRGVPTQLIEGRSEVGGGSLPEHSLPTTLLGIQGPASRWLATLRQGEPPVIARIESGLCCIDPRTVLKGEDELLIDAVEAAARRLAGK